MSNHSAMLRAAHPNPPCRSLGRGLFVASAVRRCRRVHGAPFRRHASLAIRVVRGGVEPPTFRFSGGRSYQLSYLTELGPDPANWAECRAERS